ncbi:radical SAM protein [Planctomyces sp. SH-PL14]|uniref:radical SAM protein n=1 Tax=Planctomyces sp. SH-PL14 TaxID=1632864 RepID=UPI0009463110|nr:radical SAM protein [Planctomyces sp. SH-PL14]
MPAPRYTTEQILAARGDRNDVAADRPYAFLVERERAASGDIVDVATLFLTNRECPFHCLMCDLWKNTTQESVPPGAIPAQIDHALSRLPPTRHIKLYNSGNFFDPKAIPHEDHAAIADQVRRFDHVIVENHPRLVGDEVLRFRDRIAPATFEVAMGLETIHPEVLPALNKGMTLDDFDRAAEFLRSNGIAVRAFILLRPPFLSDDEGLDWALRSIDHAFAVGVSCCSVVPTRAGNGLLEELQHRGEFAPPSLQSMERVQAEGIARGLRLRPEDARVFLDTWDLERFAPCPQCRDARRARLETMNREQVVLPSVSCPGDCLLHS